MLLSDLTKKWDAARELVNSLIDELGLQLVVAMFSGGHDSVLSAYLASHLVRNHALFFGVIWADTATGTGETRQYINMTIAQQGWRMLRGTVNPMRYEALLVQYGYPSPNTHTQMYSELKSKSMGKQLSLITTETGIRRAAMGQVTGMRMEESTRRRLMVKPYHLKLSKPTKRNKDGTLKEVQLNVLHDWTKQERDAMIAHLGIPRNPYSDLVGHSYECMCYANVSIGERELRAQISPVYEEIEQLREQMLEIALRIQNLKIKSGMIDPADKVFLSPFNIKQGWHLQHKLKIHAAAISDPFILCAACDNRRAADGGGGVDPDADLLAFKLARDAHGTNH